MFPGVQKALSLGKFNQAATTGTHAYRLGSTFYGAIVHREARLTDTQMHNKQRARAEGTSMRGMIACLAGRPGTPRHAARVCPASMCTPEARWQILHNLYNMMIVHMQVSQIRHGCSSRKRSNW